MITIDVLCSTCGFGDVETIVWNPDSWKTLWDCPDCLGIGTAKRVPSLPAVFRIALPDGNGRFSNLRRAARLESESMDLPPDKRSEHQKEIKALTKIG